LYGPLRHCCWDKSPGTW